MVDFLLNITYNKNTKNASYQVQQKVGVCMNTIITIGRQFGSAGREIGEKVAEYFGIKCYDKELLTRCELERCCFLFSNFTACRTKLTSNGNNRIHTHTHFLLYLITSIFCIFIIRDI